MPYVNNYREPIELSAGATATSLALADGDYLLTLSDASGTRWEIVAATVAAGAATLTRAQEATVAQEWGAGSVIYQSVTAGLLTELSVAMAAVAALTARVDALEAAAGGSVLIEGEGAPTSSPPAAGAHYIDTLSGEHWLASGDDYVEQWQHIATRATMTELLGGAPGATIMVAGYGDPVDPPTGPSVYVKYGSSPFRGWIAVPKSGEYWDWLQITLTEDA